jgi:hypothetical protein
MLNTRDWKTGMRLLRAIVISVALGLPGAVFGDSADDFNALLDEAWEWDLENFPMFASQLGDLRYNDRWQDHSIEAIETRRAEIREFLKRVYAIDQSALSDSDQLNHELFRRSMQSEVDGMAFNGHLMPFDHQGGVQNLDSMANYLSFTSVKDYEDWLTRMGKLGEVVDQTIKLAERGRKAGYMPPARSMPYLRNFRRPSATMINSACARWHVTRLATLYCRRIANLRVIFPTHTCQPVAIVSGCLRCQTGARGMNITRIASRPRK